MCIFNSNSGHSQLVSCTQKKPHLLKTLRQLIFPPSLFQHIFNISFYLLTYCDAYGDFKERSVWMYYLESTLLLSLRHRPQAVFNKMK